MRGLAQAFGVVPNLAATMANSRSAILAQQEPYPAVVVDRDWSIRQTNGAAAKLFGLLAAGPGPGPQVRRTCCA